MTRRNFEEDILKKYEGRGSAGVASGISANRGARDFERDIADLRRREYNRETGRSISTGTFRKPMRGLGYDESYESAEERRRKLWEQTRRTARRYGEHKPPEMTEKIYESGRRRFETNNPESFGEQEGYIERLRERKKEADKHLSGITGQYTVGKEREKWEQESKELGERIKKREEKYKRTKEEHYLEKYSEARNEDNSSLLEKKWEAQELRKKSEELKEKLRSRGGDYGSAKIRRELAEATSRMRELEKETGDWRMTDEESAAYNKILREDGEKDAKAYKKMLEETLNVREGEQIADKVIGEGVLAKAGFSVTAGLDQFTSGMKQAFTEEELPMSKYQVASAKVRDSIDTAKIAGYDVGQALYDLGTTTFNMVPSIAASAVTGGAAGAALGGAVGVGTMSLSAKGNAYKQAMQEGYEKEEAQNYSTMIGILEGGLQYALGGIGKLGGKASGHVIEAASKNIKSVAGRIAAELGGRMISEGTEEYLQDILNPVVRNVAFDENNEIKPFTAEAMYSGILGALSAGVLDGGGVAVNTAAEGRTGAQILQAEEGANSIVEQALKMDKDTAAYKMAEQMKTGKIEQTKVNMGQLYRNTVEALEEGRYGETAQEEGQEEEIQGTTGEERTETPEAMKNEEGKVEGQEEGQVEEGPVEGIVEGIEEGIEEGKEEEAAIEEERTEGKTEKTEGRKTDAENKTAEEMYTWNIPARNSEREDVIIKGIKRENGEAVAIIEDREGVKEAPLLDVWTKDYRIQEVLDKAAEYGKSGAKNVVANFNPETDRELYLKGYNAYYNAALTGLPYEKVNSLAASQISESVRRQAYFAGQNDRAESKMRVEPKANGKGGLISNETVGKLSQEQRNILDLYGKASGASIVVEETIADGKANGYYDKNGNIHVALDAENALNVVVNHEMTHYIQQNAPEHYEAYRDFVMKNFKEYHGAETDELIEQKISAYERQGVSITKEEAMDELVANASEMFLTNEEAVKNLAKENKTLAGKILDYIKGLVKKVKAIMKDVSPSSKEAKMLNENLEAAQEAERLWTKALAEANGTEQEVGEANTGKKFSLKNEAEETKDLIAVHNLSEEKMKKVIKLGGFPMPSIAIVKADKGHSKFGDISVVFRKDTIDPEMNYENRVYTADAWTPSVPQTEVEWDYEKLGEIAEKVNTSVSVLESNYLDGTVEQAVEKLGDSRQFIESYARENGIEVERPVREKELRNRKHDTDEMRNLVKEHDITTEKLQKDRELREEYLETLKRGFKNQRLAERNAERALKAITENNEMELERMQEDFETIKNGGEEADENAYMENLKKAVRGEKGELTEEFTDYAENLLRPAVLQEGVENGRDRFDKYGRERSFRETHLPNTLEGITFAMRLKGGKNAEGTTGASIQEIRGATSKELESIEQIKKESRRKMKNMTEEKRKELYDNASERLMGLMRKMVESKGEESLWSLDIAGEVLKEMAENRTKRGIEKKLAEYGYDSSEEMIKEVQKVFREAEKLPVDYFEAKPRRGVQFDEVAAVVMPEGTKTAEKLKEMGVKVLEYESGNEEERLKLINGIPEIRFSLKDTGEDSYIRESANQQKLEEILEQRLREYRNIEPDEKKIDVVAKDILKKYGSKYPKAKLAGEISEMWHYIANSTMISGKEVMQVTSAIAKNVLQASIRMNRELTDQYADMRKGIRSTTIKVSEQARAEIEYAEGYSNFRKRNMGSLRLSTKEGIDIDSYYKELAGMYPDLFDEERIANAGEQLMQISEAMQVTKPFYENIYGMNMEEMQRDVAYELYETYFNINPVRTSAEKRANHLQAEYRKTKQELRERYKEKYKEQVSKMKGEYEERVSKIEKKYKDKQANTARALAKQREVYAEARRTREEGKQATKIRQNIKKTGMEISKWLIEPNDKAHVPEALRKSVLDFITQIDFTNARAQSDSMASVSLRETMMNLNNQLKRLEEAQNKEGYAGFEMDIDSDALARIDEILEKNKGMKVLSEMDINDLKKLDDAMTGIKYGITKANKMIANARYEDVSECANEVVETLKKKKGIRSEGMVNQLLNLDMLDAQGYFRQFGDAGMSVYKEIRKGFDKRTWDIKKAQEFMKELTEKEGVTKKQIKEWTGEKAKGQTFSIGGQDITMTKAQIMSLYLSMLRPQARGHIETGGFRVQETKMRATGGKQIVGLAETVKESKVYRLNGAQIAQITDTLTEQEKRFAKGMQGFLAKECADWGNETAMQLYGYKKFNDENYFPIKTDSNQNRTNDKTVETASLYAIRNKGMTKKTVKNANNAISIGDVFDVFTKHVTDMANYHGYAVPLSDAMKWFNYTQRDENGIIQDGVKSQIQRVYGKGGNEYFVKLIQDINGAAYKGEESIYGAGLMGNYKAAAVGANIRVVLQQPTAIARAWAVMDGKYLMQGVWTPTAGREVKENSAIALWKSWGYYETMIGKTMKEVITGQSNLPEKIKNVSMAPAGYADDITWGGIWNACKAEVKDKRPELGVGSKEFLEAVAERFDEVIDQTQVVDTTLHRTQFMRKKGSLAKMQSAFMAEPSKTWNVLRNAYESKDMGRITKTAAAYVITAAATSVAAGVMDACRNGDEYKKFMEKWWEATKTNMEDNVNPLGLFPYVKEAYPYVVLAGMTAAEGAAKKAGEADLAEQIGDRKDEYEKGIFAPGRMDMQMLEQIQSLCNAVTSDTKNTWEKYLSGAALFSMATGIPLKNMMRDSEAVIGTITKKRLISSPNKNSDRIKMLYEALNGGSEEDRERYRQDILKSGEDEEYIVSSTQKIYTTNIKDYIEAGDAKSANEEIEGLRKFKKDRGIEEKKIASSIKSSISNKYKEKVLAGDEEAKEMLKKLKVDGKELYTEEDFERWEESREKK